VIVNAAVAVSSLLNITVISVIANHV
jgi:hypothetical protein